MSASNALVKQLLRRVPSTFDKVMGQLVVMEEGIAGYSHIKFLQDTGIALLPRLTVSRSKTESTEITLVEVTESLVYCYGISAAARYMFQPLMNALVPKTAQFNPKLLTKPVSAIAKNPQLLRRVVPVKAAILTSAIALSTIGIEYSLHFVKNLMSHYVFNQNKFSDIVNLSQNRSTQSGDNPVVQKAKRRILQCLGISTALIVGSAGLAGFGHQLPKSVFKPLHKAVNFFEFDHGQTPFGLSRNIFRYLFATINIAGYLDACRDNLERVEVASRLALVVSALLFGKEALVGMMTKSAQSKTPQLFTAKGQLKDLTQIAQELTKNGKPLKQAVPAFQKLLQAKNKLFYIPMGLSILLPGFGVALLNRAWTNYRYKKAETAELATNMFGKETDPLQATFKAKRPAVSIQPSIQQVTMISTQHGYPTPFPNLSANSFAQNYTNPKSTYTSPSPFVPRQSLSV